MIEEYRMVHVAGIFFDEISKIGMQTWYTGNDFQLFQAIENKAFFVKL